MTLALAYGVLRKRDRSEDVAFSLSSKLEIREVATFYPCIFRDNRARNDDLFDCPIGTEVILIDRKDQVRPVEIYERYSRTVERLYACGLAVCIYKFSRHSFRSFALLQFEWLPCLRKMNNFASVHSRTFEYNHDWLNIARAAA